MGPARTARWIATFALALASRNLVAQRVLRGVVRDSTMIAPLGGAVVSVIDSSGKTTSRTISDAGGKFALSLTPAAARIHAIRIGYRPRDAALPAIGQSLELAMERLPPILDAVRVSDRELCPGSSDRGAAFQYWEQARAGLLAEVVAREAFPAMTTAMTYERRTLPGDDLVRRQSTQSHRGQTKRPFIASGSAGAFADRGYALDLGADRVYSAPDADVLLDESFAATHCFHLQLADGAHSGQIGLAFSPVPGRPDSLVDVAGVIWLDRSAPSLRSFDFHYTNLEPAAARASTGGHIEFRTVANGISFIERWSLRLAILGPSTRVAASSAQIVRDPLQIGITPSRHPSRMDRGDLVAREIQETGGQIIETSWPDGTSWRDEPTGISGVLTQRGDGRPIPRAVVTLSGTNDTATTNERGEFSLSPIVPGRYMLVVTDTALDAYAPPRSLSRTIDVVRGQVAETKANLPSALEIIAQICRGSSNGSGTTVVAGRVRFANGKAPPRVEVRATWQADYAGYYGVSATIKTMQQTIDVDDNGRFVVCGVAIDRPLSLQLVIGSSMSDTTFIPREGRMTSVDWRPRTP